MLTRICLIAIAVSISNQSSLLAEEPSIPISISEYLQRDSSGCIAFNRDLQAIVAVIDCAGDTLRAETGFKIDGSKLCL